MLPPALSRGVFRVLPWLPVRVYLAAPWFTPEQAGVLQFLENALATVPCTVVFSPRTIGGVVSPSSSREERQRIFRSNIVGMRWAHLVLAVLYRDTGVTWEVGYTSALAIPIVGILPAEAQGKVNLMLANTFVDVLPVETVQQWGSEEWLNRLRMWRSMRPGHYVMMQRDIE